MPRIKHIAIRTPDPEQTAAFYVKVFGLEEVGKAAAGCYLSDGYINLAILKSVDQGDGVSPRDTAGYAGIDHLGFMVEDMDDACRKLEAEGAQPLNQRIEMNNPHGQSYYELKYRGPDQQVIDISGSGWIGA